MKFTHKLLELTEQIKEKDSRIAELEKYKEWHDKQIAEIDKRMSNIK